MTSIVNPVEDREFVEKQLDGLLDEMYARAEGNDERFGDMLAHFVAMTVAPSLAATNRVLRLPRVSAYNGDQQVRLSLSGDTSYVEDLATLEGDLAEAVTNAVLHTLLGPAPRIPEYEPEIVREELFLN